MQYISTLDDEKEYELSVKRISKKRSIQANNYSWELTDKLSEVMLIQGLKLSKDEMHAEMVLRYGQPLIDSKGEQVFLSTSQDVNINEFYPYARNVGEGTVNGKLFNHYRIFRGSHTYNTKEMSLFIKGIVEECKEHGIETMTPDEIARLKYE